MAAPIGNTNALGNEGGAPTKYRDEYAQQAYKLCLLGFTDEQLAAFFEVTETTINNWKKENVEFFESVKKGKVIADGEAAEGLYKRAVGFTYEEVTFEKIDNKQTLEVTPESLITQDAYKKKVVTKMVAPDPGAAMNWLSNRQKDLWRNKQDFTTDGESFNKPMDMSGVPIEILRELAKHYNHTK